jgi:hypothetical protein
MLFMNESFFWGETDMKTIDRTGTVLRAARPEGAHFWRFCAGMALGLFCLACANPTGGPGGGGGGGSSGGPTFTLTLPGYQDGKTAYPNPGGLPQADVLAALHYQIDLSGPEDAKVSQKAQGVTSVNVKVPIAGKWDIAVEARLNGQQLYASGSMTAEVRAGGNSRVNVPLKRAAGIGAYTVSGQILSEYGPLSGALVRLMQGGSGF